MIIVLATVWHAAHTTKKLGHISVKVNIELKFVTLSVKQTTKNFKHALNNTHTFRGLGLPVDPLRV